MALKQELMASSLPAAAASKLGYDTPVTAVAAAGSGQSSATSLTANFSIVTSGTGGVIITEARAPTVVVNTSGSSVTLYPPSGCYINGLTVNTGFTVTNNKQALVQPAGLYFGVFLSA